MGKPFNIAETFGEVLKNVPNSGTEQIEYIDIVRLHDDPRNFYSMDGLEELAANIEKIGLQQPLRVRPDPEYPGGYVIVSGHRRRAALRMAVDEDGRGDLRRVPCIVESGELSPAMQELRMIYANAATRDLTANERAKQAERVKALLYELAEAGEDFPGRMRDHVAEIVKASKSQLARWDVIRKGLIPELLAKWESGKLNEAQAYALARIDEAFQKRIAKATPKVENYQGSYIESFNNLRTKEELTYEPDMTCRDGTACSHGNAFLLHDLSAGGWGRPCKGKTCCLNCDYGAKARSYGSPCERMCAKARDVRQKRAQKEKDAEEAQRREELSKDQRDEAEACERIARAADAAGLDGDVKLPAGHYGEGKITLEAVRKRAGGNFDGYDRWYNTVRMRECKELAEQARALGCSADWLLGLTGELQPAAAAAAPAGGWIDAKTLPDHPCECVVEFDLGEDHLKEQHKDLILCRWDGDWYWRGYSHPVCMPALRWCEVPCTGVPRVVPVPAAGEWIRVEDALPESGVNVLILDSDGDADIDRIDADTGKFYYGNGASYHVTHWMPLPEKPEEE